MLTSRSRRILLASLSATTLLASLPFLSLGDLVTPTTTTAPALTLIAPLPNPPANSLTLATERVVVYKDGYALIIKSASATTDTEGRAFTTQVPDAAVLGTFWAISDQKTLGLRAEWDEAKTTRSRTVNCLTVKDLLRANVGKKVTLTLDATEKRTGRSGLEDGPDKTLTPDATTEKRTLTGTLSQILDDSSPPKIAFPRSITTLTGQTFTLESTAQRSPFEDFHTSARVTGAAPLSDDTALVRDLSPTGGDYIVLDGPDVGGKTVLPSARVLFVTGENLTTTLTRAEEVFTRTKRLTVDFGKENANKKVALKLFYFTPGIRWIPTYRISGTLQDKADIALQGEIVNDLEDINDAAIDLVVGVPNFRFKDAPSPLTFERTMLATLANLPRNDFNQNFYNGNRFSNSSFHSGSTVVFSDTVTPSPDLAAGEQDLFVYPLQKTSLKRGARATLPLWQQNTDLKHLYTYDVKTQRSRSTGGMVAYKQNQHQPNPQSTSPNVLSLNTIWHQLELVNNSKSPWTTGPALIMKGNLPLGQDLLTYTPPGSKACVPVTIAVDLRATTDEEEVLRQNAALKVDGNEYALIKKKGTISLTSFRKEPSTMRISLSTGGKIDNVSDEGKIKINDFRPDDWDDQSYMRPNNHSDVTWEFTLDPGETKTLTYTLSSYIR